MKITGLSRREFLKGGALIIGFSLSGVSLALNQETAKAPVRTLNLDEVDAFLAVRKDGSVIVYSGKVDLGTGHRIVMRQIVAEELSIGVERIELIEGDTALTPNQGPTAGSTGVMRGGMQLRQAAATAREALLARGAAQLQSAQSELRLNDGFVSTANGTARASIGELVGDRAFGLKMNPKAPLKNPAQYTVVGKSLPRPDLPAKLTGRHTYVHDFTLPGMLHGRPLRPPTVGARLLGVNQASIRHLPGVRVVRIKDFLGVVAKDEWAAVRAARELKARWSEGSGLIGNDNLQAWARRGPFVKDEIIVNKGDTRNLATNPRHMSATYAWPIQSHASMGPSCAVADVQAGQATIWSASQATHRFHPAYAHMLGLPLDKVRLVYLDGSGCYGMNGHDDAAADAALLSKAVGQPVRVQWMREDELGWDPKGPPQLLDLRATLDAQGHIDAWEAEMWVPLATANLAYVPLLAPTDAGIEQPAGQMVGLVSQNAAPSFQVANVKVTAHWLESAPLRPSNIRAPGKVANCFAVESFVDELAAAAKIDPLEFRLRDLPDPRGIEVLKRCAALIGWKPASTVNRQSGDKTDTVASGRGLAYIHYKNSENYVAMAIDVEVDRKSGEIRVKRVACAHDCGLMINPDGVRNQVEGNILQTLSRSLFEETTFDRERVTSVDWASYRILRFPELPELRIDLVEHPELPPLGAGEASSAPVPAALANAVFDAVGVRLREAPFTPGRVLAALGKSA